MIISVATCAGSVLDFGNGSNKAKLARWQCRRHPRKPELSQYPCRSRQHFHACVAPLAKAMPCAFRRKFARSAHFWWWSTAPQLLAGEHLRQNITGKTGPVEAALQLNGVFIGL
jgi:hypothetical protein